MSASNYLESIILDHILGNTAYSAPATVYIGLHTADPGETGATAELSGGNYSRVAVTNNSTNWPAASGGSKSNGTAINFPTPSGTWGTVTHWSIWDASSSGNCLFSGALSTSKTINSGDPVSFAISALTVTAD